MGLLDNITLTIEPFDYKLEVLGIDNQEIIRQLEEALNKDNNSNQLFFIYYIIVVQIYQMMLEQSIVFQKISRM